MEIDALSPLQLFGWSWYIFLVYECDVDYRYQKSWSNDGDMFEMVLTFFASLQLFGLKW